MTSICLSHHIVTRANCSTSTHPKRASVQTEQGRKGRTQEGKGKGGMVLSKQGHKRMSMSMRMRMKGMHTCTARTQTGRHSSRWLGLCAVLCCAVVAPRKEHKSPKQCVHLFCACTHLVSVKSMIAKRKS